MNNNKKAIVCGGGGFIGGHLAKRLKEEGFWVRVVDIVDKHEFWNHDEICDEYISGDLRDPMLVKKVFDMPFDEAYQLAADMGGAGYIFTGENDANVMHNSALVNLNVAHYATLAKVKRIFIHLLLVCILSIINWTPIIQIVRNPQLIQLIRILSTDGKSYLVKEFF